MDLNHDLLSQSQACCRYTNPAKSPSQIGAQQSGSDLEKEEGDCGYGAFAALTQTAEAKWSRLLLTW